MAAFTALQAQISNWDCGQWPPNDDARSFTNAPAGRKPIRDYAGLARVRVGHGVPSGGLKVMTYRIRNISWPDEGGEGRRTWRSDQAKKQTLVMHPKFFAHKPLLQP